MKILGIGNAIVDVICKVEDKFITQNNLTKSTMKLVNENGPVEFVTLAVMAGVTLWRKDLLIGLFTALVVFFASNSLLG